MPKPGKTLAARYACLPLVLLAPAAANAANGYTQYGYGSSSKGMAGVSYAIPQDSLIPSSNPAGLSLVGDRADFGVDWLQPHRTAAISGNRQVTLASADGSWDGDEIPQFYVPEFGFSRRYDDDLTYGVAVYGNGGLNTDYTDNPFGGFGATGHAGVDLAQVYVSPTLAWQASERMSFGLAVNLAWQQAKIYGLDAFATTTFPGPYSVAPDKVTNNGYSRSYGLGYRLGWLWEPIDGLMVGASWQPETRMTRFKKYEGLIAQHGRIDGPPNYGAGLSYRWGQQLALAVDIQRIDYHSVKSVGTPLQPFVDGQLLGSDDGPGFGWRDMTIYKFGLNYAPVPRLHLLAGYSYGRQPIPRSQTLFNILTPAIIEEHYTAGLNYQFGAVTLGAYYFYAPAVTLHGRNSIPPNQLTDPLPPKSFGGGEADLHAGGQTAGLSIGWRY